MYDIQKIISDLKQIAAECEKVTSGNVSHRIANIEHGILNIADYLENYCQLGWYPASEWPPVDKETGLSDEVIAIQDRFCDGERVIYTRIVGSGWKHDNIKWWYYPPKED